MPLLNELKQFDLAGATLSLWAFKKSGPAGEPPHYNGHWIETTNELDAALKETIDSSRNAIEETLEYGILVQNNEGSALTVDALETHAGLIMESSAAELDQLRLATIKQVQNTKFVAAKLVIGDQVLYAVTKTNSSWQTRAAKRFLSVVFSDEQLALADDPTFEIPKTVDFFIFNGTVLIQNKGHFESVLSYKEAHEADFTSLQQEEEFLAVFSDIGPIVEHVGVNKIQLRRACAIKSKGHYKSVDFMTRLRERHAQYGLTLNFDDEGKIIPSAETCRDIFTALLDHRLASAFSTQIYDVPNTVLVQVQ